MVISLHSFGSIQNLNFRLHVFVQILKFSTQCIHQKVEFTAFGLFTIDFSMILTASQLLFLLNFLAEIHL